MEQTRFNQKFFFLGVTLIILGLFLSWYAVGDLVSVGIRLLVIKWTTAFAEVGGKFYFPSVQQNISPGLLSLIGAICLISIPSPKIGE